jgi:hypothetical protein
MLTQEQEEHILKDLMMSANRSKEFLKVLSILQNDPELRPLIFEHEALLRALKDMGELKAEQMLSILTAAETEMYETSKKNEESQQLSNSMQKSGKINISQNSIHVQTDNEADSPQQSDKIDKLEKEKLMLEVQLK